SAASRGQDLAAAMGIDLSTAQVHVRGERDQPAVIQAQAQNPPTAPTAEDPVQLLAQLAQLHAQGVVSDAEFASQKARLLRS
ncbi:MAG TPA: SHOCT domain-containing protein, partial [Acidimicrobiales bacterium]|nr:SHOCT domain-containing protein [Acidimicrobiales bacterium]